MDGHIELGLDICLTFVKREVLFFSFEKLSFLMHKKVAQVEVARKGSIRIQVLLQEKLWKKV